MWQRGIGSRVVLLKVPAGWGRSRVLGRVAEDVVSANAPVTVVIPVPGRELPDGGGLQAAEVRRRLSSERIWPQAAELLDVDRPGGAVQLAVEVLGLFVPAGAALVANRVTVLIRNLRERSNTRSGGAPARAATAAETAAVARAARAVAEVSRHAPVVVLIDDAERLDLDLAVALLENLMFCRDGQVLAVVAVAPGSDLAAALRAGDRVALAGVVQTVDVDPDMGYAARTALARELCPGLPEPVIRRIGERTRTFDDVLKVTGSERLAEIRPDDDPRDVLTVADAVIDAGLKRGPPSAEAVMVAWTGGVAHPRQVAAALAVTGEETLADDLDLARSESLVRLADPGSSRFTGPVIALPGPVCRAMATAVLEQAAEVCADPVSGLVDRAVAGRAAHHIRRYLGEHLRPSLVRVQRVLAEGLEAAGDFTAGYKIAKEALEECPRGDPYGQDRQQLQAAVARLASAEPAGEQDPLVAELTGEAIRGGAAMGLEARVWAAVNLLGMPGRSASALRLIDQVSAELNSRNDLGDSEAEWRLLLAFWAGRAGHPSAAQPLLAPLLSLGDDDAQDAAMRVLRAINDPSADDRLQIETLEAELATGPPDDDDLLRLHAALSRIYAKVGDYRRAREHARLEVPLRQRLQGPEHPDTLAARANLAECTGQAGDAPAARDQFAALLPVFERVLGPEQPDTLTTRGRLAWWTGQAGDPAASRDQYGALLPVFERVLRPQHLDTLAARNNLALRTGQAGDPAAAQDQYAALLPVMNQVLGPEYPATLAARNNLAECTGLAGDAAGARDQFAALLPVFERVRGPEHPATLTARNNLAYWTGQAGDEAAARDQFAALLPLRERVLGPEHPDTLAARSNLASWTGQAGDAAGARDQFAALLPLRERVLGPEHPDTLAARHHLAYWTERAEHGAGQA